MPEITLSEAVARFAQTLKGPARQPTLTELNRFVAWFRPDLPLSNLRPHDVELYAEKIGPATPENTKRADYVRTFLTFLKKQTLIEQSLAPHLRLRKSSSIPGSGRMREEAPIHLTKTGVDALKAELETLVDQRQAIRDEIRRAMQDKDFRENAPLDAAKNKQGHQEARIREIESILKRGVILEDASAAGRVRVGSGVLIRNLKTGSLTRFSIVGPTEANAADGKISSVSPVGKALLDASVGDEVEVSAPAGVMLLKVEEIEG